MESTQMVTTKVDPWADDEVEGADTPEALEKQAEANKADDPDTGESGDEREAQKVAQAAKKAVAKKTAAPSPAPPPQATKEAKVGATGGLGASLDDQVTYISELLYGPEGTGKTTAALRMTKLCVGENAHKKVLLVDAEAGAKVIALRQRGVDTSKIEVWPKPSDGGPGAICFDGFEKLLTELEGGAVANYIGTVWDSGTEITKRILDTVTAEARVKDERLGKNRGRFQINLEDHGVASAQLRELLRRFRDLPWHFVITALERRDVDGDTGKVKYGPAMSPAMANDVSGLCDIVGYAVVEEVGPDGIEVRSARFTPVKQRRAKDRFGMLPAKLADPFFDRTLAYILGDLDKSSDPVQARVREIATGSGSVAETPDADTVEASAAAAAS